MADKHKSKKQKVVPPTAPRVCALSVKSNNHARAQSVSDVMREQTPSSGMSMLSKGAYPTPNPTIHKDMSQAESTKPCSNCLPSLDLRAASTPRSALQSTANPSLSNLDNARISKQGSPKIKRKKPVLPSKSSSSDASGFLV